MIAVVYVSTGIIGLLARPPEARLLQQVEPYLTVMEISMILFAANMVAVQASVYAFAQPDRKAYGLLALMYTAAFAVLTCAVHFVSLTVGRQVKAEAMPQLLQQLSFDRWPSVVLMVDLLAWDFFVALSLLFAAPVFPGGGLRRHIRAWMIVGGVLCFTGTLGPLLGNPRIQFVAIVGYAFALPVVCALLAILFRREASTIG